jgi:hypothetical protein
MDVLPTFDSPTTIKFIFSSTIIDSWGVFINYLFKNILIYYFENFTSVIETFFLEWFLMRYYV